MLKLIQSKSYFERHIVILFLFCLIDVIALFLNINLPLGFIYGPLLYLGFKSVTASRLPYAYLHILPFFIFLFTYILIHLGKQLSIHWVSVFQGYYEIIYNIVLPISLLSYSAVLVISHKKSSDNGSLKEKYIRTVRFISVLMVLLSFLLFIKIILPDFVVGINYSLIISGFLILPVFASAYHLGSSFYRNELLYIPQSVEKQSLYGGIDEDEFRMKLQQCLEDSKLYLNSSITLEMLAEKTGLSKHHLSYLLNAYIGKSFYQLIAEHRIVYAKKRLNEDVLITIEALAYECGFNSKTTLNKYFKESTGFAPSQYRSILVSRQLSLR